MGIMLLTPHVVQVIRPAVTRDAATNAASRDYDAQPRREIECNFQRRSGRIMAGAEGRFYSEDAALYTLDAEIGVDDLVIVDIAGTKGQFIVASAQSKYATDGELRHIEVSLTKEATR